MKNFTRHVILSVYYVWILFRPMLAENELVNSYRVEDVLDKANMIFPTSSYLPFFAHNHTECE